MNYNSKDYIETLEIKIRHLKNQRDVVKEQYERTTEKYLKILDDLSKSNKQLQLEIAERNKAEKALKKYQCELEIRIQERTAELKRANEELQKEIAEHKKAEKALLESESLLKQQKSALEKKP